MTDKYSVETMALMRDDEEGNVVLLEDHQREVAQLQARVAELEAALQLVRAVHESNTGPGRDSWVEVRRVLGVE